MGMVACFSPHVPVVEQAGSLNRLPRLRRSSLNVRDGCVCLLPSPPLRAGACRFSPPLRPGILSALWVSSSSLIMCLTEAMSMCILI